MWWYMPEISTTWEAVEGGLKLKISPGKVSETLSQTQNKNKRAG
jgi:hypothetical protein